jgi:hypothetical protein
MATTSWAVARVAAGPNTSPQWRVENISAVATAPAAQWRAVSIVGNATSDVPSWRVMNLAGTSASAAIWRVQQLTAVSAGLSQWRAMNVTAATAGPTVSAPRAYEPDVVATMTASNAGGVWAQVSGTTVVLTQTGATAVYRTPIALVQDEKVFSYTLGGLTSTTSHLTYGCNERLILDSVQVPYVIYQV